MSIFIFIAIFGEQGNKKYHFSTAARVQKMFLKYDDTILIVFKVQYAR